MRKYNWINEVTIGKAYIMRQYVVAGNMKLNKNVNRKGAVTPIIINSWFKGHNVEESSVGENYLMYIGVTELIIPMMIPCRHLAISSTLISQNCNKKQTMIIAIAKISKLCFRLHFLIRIELQNAPSPPAKDMHPVSIPCIRLLDASSIP